MIWLAFSISNFFFLIITFSISMRWTQKHVYFKLTCVALISYILHYTTKQKNALLITEKVFCLLSLTIALFEFA